MSTPTLLPVSDALRVEQITTTPDTICIPLVTVATSVRCPVCGHGSQRVHSHYQRTLADVAWNRVAVAITVQTRKFFCDQPGCARRLFAEPLSDLAARYARKTLRLQQALYLLGYARGGEAGARLARGLGLLVSPDTLLRRVRQVTTAAVSVPASVRVVGVDAWAFRKGRR